MSKESIRTTRHPDGRIAHVLVTVSPETTKNQDGEKQYTAPVMKWLMNKVLPTDDGEAYTFGGKRWGLPFVKEDGPNEWTFTPYPEEVKSKKD